MNPDEQPDHATVGDAEIREQTAGALGLTGGGVDWSWVRDEFAGIVGDLKVQIDGTGRARIISRGRPREDR